MAAGRDGHTEKHAQSPHDVLTFFVIVRFRDGNVGRSAVPPICNVLELEELARTKLAREAFDYYASGAGDEVTLRANRSAFERRAILYRVLVDVSVRRMATTVLGVDVSMPVLVAPTAFHKLACDEGELATARAARACGTAMMLSSLSNTDVEDVAAVHPERTFFQLYVYRD